MLYNEKGEQVMHKDLPTAEKIEESYNTIFGTVIDTQAYVYEIRTLLIWVIVFAAFAETATLILLIKLMLRLM